MNTKIIFTIVCMLVSMNVVHAQGANAFEGMMLTNGKLYTVVGVLLIIFIGIILYLFNTDKKLKSLENQIKSK